MTDRELVIALAKERFEQIIEKADGFMHMVDAHIDHINEPVKEGTDETYSDQLMLILPHIVQLASEAAWTLTTSLIGYMMNKRKQEEKPAQPPSVPPKGFREDSVEPLLDKENSFPEPLKETSFPIPGTTTITLNPEPLDQYGRKPYSFPWPRKKEESK